MHRTTPAAPRSVGEAPALPAQPSANAIQTGRVEPGVDNAGSTKTKLQAPLRRKMPSSPQTMWAGDVCSARRGARAACCSRKPRKETSSHEPCTRTGLLAAMHGRRRHTRPHECRFAELGQAGRIRSSAAAPRSARAYRRSQVSDRPAAGRRFGERVIGALTTAEPVGTFRGGAPPPPPRSPRSRQEGR